MKKEVKHSALLKINSDVRKELKIEVAKRGMKDYNELFIFMLKKLKKDSAS